MHYPTQRYRRRLAENLDSTELARSVFGGFVPRINYPSPQQIEDRLNWELYRSVSLLAQGDRSIFASTFTGIISAITSLTNNEIGDDSRDSETIRANISSLLEDLQDTQIEYGLPEAAFSKLQSVLATRLPQQGQGGTTRRILRIYEEAVQERASNLRVAFAAVRNYVNSVNDFLEGKQLVTDTNSDEPFPELKVSHADQSYTQLDSLSSGERQIVGLIYSASRLADGDVVLVDEPEISLHIDWQRRILQAMNDQLPSEKQLIVCTHSPVIASAFSDHMIELTPTPSTVTTS